MTTATMRSQPDGARIPGFFSQLSAEWTKIRSVRAFYIQVGLALLLSVGMSALICLAIGSSWDQLSPNEQADFDPVFTSFFGMAFSGIVLTVTGVSLVSSEYTSGMIRLTMAITPSRARVLASKAVIIAIVSWTVGLLVTLGSFYVGQAVLASYEGIPTTSLGVSDTQRAVIAAWLTAPLFPLIGAALGAILRSTASAITASMGLIFAPAIFGGLLPRFWQENLLAYLPGNASDTLLRSDSDYLTYLEPAVAILVILGWIVAFFAVAYILMVRRDV